MRRASLSNLKSSNFMRWFTGIVYYLFGRDIWTGFFVYSLIAFVGSYLWYRAAVVALPALDRKLFFILITFAPSIVFWPAGIGKEALMQFGLGSIALGVAYILNGQVFYGFLVAYRVLAGYVVRAHLLGLATIALAFAYVLGRSASRPSRRVRCKTDRHHPRRPRRGVRSDARCETAAHHCTDPSRGPERAGSNQHQYDAGQFQGADQRLALAAAPSPRRNYRVASTVPVGSPIEEPDRRISRGLGTRSVHLPSA